ncbi:hypothetical protein PtB15_15B109 [Puccinia triticina]|nr:hypothetical protein PtB15_15B109 [Puccinia triticina]
MTKPALYKASSNQPRLTMLMVGLFRAQLPNAWGIHTVTQDNTTTLHQDKHIRPTHQ